MGAAAAGVGALAGVRTGSAAGTLPIVAATMPAGWDEVSAMNKGLALSYGMGVASMLGLSDLFQAAYEASITTAQMGYTVADEAAGMAIKAVGALAGAV